MYRPYLLERGERPLDIAVVGTGIAGMSAAWLLAKRHRVTVYERENRIGGHTHTVDVQGPDGPIPVDTGFIVYNEPNYPNLTALFRHLGVTTEASRMTFSVSLDGGAFEYAGNLKGLTAQPRLLANRDYWRMLVDTVRFYREAPKLLEAPQAIRTTLGEYLTAEGYSDAFARLHLLPMGAAIWSSSLDDIRAHPVAAFARFFANHGLLKLAGRPEWRTVSGGSREYVKCLTASYADGVKLSAQIVAIERDAMGVTIRLASGESRRHDRVVMAAHPDQALTMLAQPSEQERALLGRFRYRPNSVILHSDETLMPRRRRAWASWNYLGAGASPGDDDLCVTYWMNRLQNIRSRLPLFVTLNPPVMPRDDRMHGVYCCSHPVFDAAALEAQSQLWRLQGVRHTWFCGSYFGSGFHEDALQAGLAAAEAAGGVRRSWRVAGESDRIALAPHFAEARG